MPCFCRVGLRVIYLFQPGPTLSNNKGWVHWNAQTASHMELRRAGTSFMGSGRTFVSGQTNKDDGTGCTRVTA